MTAGRAAVLLATYNGERYLPELLDSLAAQTHGDLEVIVRDDGSTDATLEILESRRGRLHVRVLPPSPRLGAARSFMRLLVEAGDGYDAYFLADQDDSWAPGKIERAMARLAGQGTEPTLYCAGLDIVDADLRHIAYSMAPRVVGLENALVQNIATGCTSALNASARTLVIGHLPERFLWHDWWYYIVLSALGRVVYDDYPSLKYRQHGGNVIGGATGFYDDFSRRVTRFLAWNREGIFGVSAQAEEFGRCFGALLSAPQRELVRELVDGRKSIPRRVRLAFSSRFVRQKAVDTAILRILFLIGRF